MGTFDQLDTVKVDIADNNDFAGTSPAAGEVEDQHSLLHPNPQIAMI